MASTSAIKIQDDIFSNLNLTKTVSAEEKVACYSRGLDSITDTNPVVVLVHGYPQSSYEWRYLISQLRPTVPIFAADLPGYGSSAPIKTNDKLSVGTTILNALKFEIGRSSSTYLTKNLPIVLIGHDRGARVTHCLAVSGHESFDILGVVLIDIIPTSSQWQSNTSSLDMAQAYTGYFHWPLLANVDLATRMITAFGRANWCKEMILRWAGTSSNGLQSLKADGALHVYGEFFEQEHTLKASCEDYKEGASTDIKREEQNQKDGKKITQPTLVLYSDSYLGSRSKFPDVWQDWVGEDVKLESHAFKNGVGHFVPEEAPEECANVINQWLKTIVT